ncbi:uncharacterized protein LOC134667023 [Cydia fagiglandana]|uniref:uncharacterized protein LOC134667023 n=1 Tax=Cydia fagiglandana TaxID=1458189 RepID=UPI002FEE17A7
MMNSNSSLSSARSVASISREEQGSGVDNNDNVGGCTSTMTTTYPLILTGGKYFEVKVTTDINALGGSKDPEKVEATCIKCQTVIKGSLKATSNFKVHLKRKYPDALLEYEKDKENTQGKRKKKQKTLNEKSLTQMKLNISSFKSQKEHSVQQKLDNNILNYVVNSMKPLSTVDDPNFVKMFTDISEQLQVMSRRTLGRKIDTAQKTVTDKLISIFSKLDYVSTTADIWSTKTRSFLGVTAHWINEATLERMSCVLSFNRFKGSHTYDKIAEMLFEVQSDFRLAHDQMISTTTDNGSNFVKAFREFGIVDYVPDFSGPEDTMELDNFSASDTLYEEVLLVNNSEELETRELYLPRHLRCASHTLSLLATTDLNNYIKNSLISRIHYSATAKCTLLWNMSRKPKSAEIIKEHLGHQLLYPCPTRWNSLYDAILHLMKSKTKLNSLFEQLGKANTFSAVELEYLEELLEVLKPIASALDYLQGDNC